MTPKEKSQELVDKMYFVNDLIGNYPICFETAKQCALITVDEIRDNLPLITDIQNYWQEVKQEIQAL